jgi:hypothetical protein
VGITERSAYGIVLDLTDARYIVKKKVGSRNYYQIQAHLPLPESSSRNAQSAKCWPSWAAASCRPVPIRAEVADLTSAHRVMVFNSSWL